MKKYYMHYFCDSSEQPKKELHRKQSQNPISPQLKLKIKTSLHRNVIKLNDTIQ